MVTKRKKRLLVFATGGKNPGEGGSGVRELIEHSLTQDASYEVIGIVSNYPGGGAYDISEEYNISFYFFDGPFTAEGYQKVIEVFQPDFVALSGWVKPVEGIDPRICFNIHPGRLPHTAGKYGHFVHEEMIRLRDDGITNQTAINIHFVTSHKKHGYDTGPRPFEYRIIVRKKDMAETLAKRVNEKERAWQWIITDLICSGRIGWDGKNPDTLYWPKERWYKFGPDKVGRLKK